jgi:hypothetical protein
LLARSCHYFGCIYKYDFFFFSGGVQEVLEKQRSASQMLVYELKVTISFCILLQFYKNLCAKLESIIWRPAETTPDSVLLRQMAFWSRSCPGDANLNKTHHWKLQLLPRRIGTVSSYHHNANCTLWNVYRKGWHCQVIEHGSIPWLKERIYIL